MKKMLIVILAAMLAVTFSFAVCGCRKAEDQKTQEEVVNTPQSPAPEAIPAPGPEAIPRAPLGAPYAPPSSEQGNK